MSSFDLAQLTYFSIKILIYSKNVTIFLILSVCRLGQAQAGGGGDAALDPVDDFLEMQGVVDEVEEQAVDRQDGAFGIFQGPLLVVAIEQAQVVGVDRVFN